MKLSRAGQLFLIAMNGLDRGPVHRIIFLRRQLRGGALTVADVLICSENRVYKL